VTSSEKIASKIWSALDSYPNLFGETSYERDIMTDPIRGGDAVKKVYAWSASNLINSEIEAIKNRCKLGKYLAKDIVEKIVPLIHMLPSDKQMKLAKKYPDLFGPVQEYIHLGRTTSPGNSSMRSLVHVNTSLEHQNLYRISSNQSRNQTMAIQGIRRKMQEFQERFQSEEYKGGDYMFVESVYMPSGAKGDKGKASCGLRFTAYLKVADKLKSTSENLENHAICRRINIDLYEMTSEALITCDIASDGSIRNPGLAANANQPIDKKLIKMRCKVIDPRTLTMPTLNFDSLDDLVEELIQPLSVRIESDLANYSKFYPTKTQAQLEQSLIEDSKKHQYVQYGICFDDSERKLHITDQKVSRNYVKLSFMSKAPDTNRVEIDTLYVHPWGYTLWVQTENSLSELVTWWKKEGYRDRKSNKEKFRLMHKDVLQQEGQHHRGGRPVSKRR